MISGKKETWNDEQLLYDKQYWEARSYMIRIHPEELAKLKAFFLKQCKRKQCDEVNNVFDNFEKIKPVEENSEIYYNF